MKSITLKTASCDSIIYCGEGAFAERTQHLRDKKLFIITDSNVNKIYAQLIKETFGTNYVYVMPAGEGSKNHVQLFKILSAMLENGVTRSSTVVALGGGVVGDVAGLAASLYMRGVNLVQIPTTLLSQVDSSVGGKTAVDFKGVKNVVGTFYQPGEVIVDPLFLATLPKREIRCGLGEIVKYGALDEGIYKSLLKNRARLKDMKFLEDITFDCISHKADVVRADERDVGGRRKTLNLGHTTGHAFELYYRRKSHGEFVLIGMYYELYIARSMGICTGKYADNIEKLIKKVIGKIPAYPDAEKAAYFAKYDKKNTAATTVSVIVPKSEGESAEIRLPLEEYARYIARCRDSLAEKGMKEEKIMKLAVIGKDVSASDSPKMHSFIAKNMGNEISYDKISIPEGEFENRIDYVIKNYDGFNVTIPYKLSIMPRLKKIVGDAQLFGAVNTVLKSDMSGHNTDGAGFMLMLRNNGVDAAGKDVLLLGAGGAGRAVAKKLAEAGAHVYVYDRNSQSASSLAAECKGITAIDEVAPEDYYLIINATGVGMHKTVGVSPVGEDVLCRTQTAVDLIYVPAESEFLRIARSLGKKTINGQAMLFYQAYFAECIYFGVQPDDAQAKELFQKYITEA